ASSPGTVGLIIRFLFIGTRLCSTLLSDPASRRRRCASLSLHLHQVVKRTFTSKLSIMLGTRKYPPAEPEALRLLAPQRGLIATDQNQNPRLATSEPIGKSGRAWVKQTAENVKLLLPPRQSRAIS